jgi:hypothetical protein
MSGARFLSFIADRYHRKTEDVASDVVTYLINEFPVQDAIRAFLTTIGFQNSPASFFAIPRKSGEYGVPDIRLRESGGEVEIILENKFWARLTPNQPCGYLREIDVELVLFVVPKSRVRRIWKKVCSCCELDEMCGPITDIVGYPLHPLGRVREKYVAVISWDNLIDVFKHDTENTPDIQVFVEQLSKLCEVEETMEIRNISADHVGERAKFIAEDVYKFMRLVKPIVEAAQEKGFFSAAEKQDKSARGDARGNFFIGIWGVLGAWDAWVGFDARVWAKHGETPIWIECGSRWNIRDLKKLLPDPGALSWFEDEDQIVVPIRLEPDADQETIIDSAVEQIGRVKKLLEAK